MELQILGSLVRHSPRVAIVATVCIGLSGCAADRLANPDGISAPEVSFAGATTSIGLHALDDVIAKARGAATAARLGNAPRAHTSWMNDASPSDLAEHFLMLRRTLVVSASDRDLSQDGGSLPTQMADFGAVDGTSLITKSVVTSTIRRVDFISSTICQGYGTFGEAQSKKVMMIKFGVTSTWADLKVYVDTAAIANHTDSYYLGGPPQQGEMQTEHGCRASSGDVWDTKTSNYIVGV